MSVRHVGFGNSGIFCDVTAYHDIDVFANIAVSVGLDDFLDRRPRVCFSARHLKCSLPVTRLVWCDGLEDTRDHIPRYSAKCQVVVVNGRDVLF